MTTEAEATTEAPEKEDPSTDLETEREQILKALAEHDRAVSGEVHEPSSESSKPPGDLAPGETEKKPEETSQEQPKTRQEKEDERKDRTWSRIQQDKEAARQDREDAARIKAESEKFAEAELRKLREARQTSVFRPENFDDAAERFEDEGNDEMAANARERAQHLRDELAAEKSELARFQAEQQWQANVEELAKDQPDLKVDGSELNETVKTVLQSNPLLQRYPDGIQHAVRAANLYIENRQLKDVQVRNDELQAQVKELEQKLHPGAATPVPPVSNTHLTLPPTQYG